MRGRTDQIVLEALIETREVDLVMEQVVQGVLLGADKLPVEYTAAVASGRSPPWRRS
jgi:hypothetical protein